MKMSKVQILRALLKQRLPADDEEEIFELFERTTAEYEEELCRYEEKVCRLKEENERQRKLLDAVSNFDNKTGVQQLLVQETEVSPEQKQQTSKLHQEDPELHHVKEEELWSCEERKHLQVLEVNSLMYADSDVKPQSSLCHQPHSEEITEAEPVVSSSAEQIQTEDEKEDWRGLEQVGKLDQDASFDLHRNAMISPSVGPEIDASDADWKEANKLKSDSKSLKNTRIPVRENGCNIGVKPFNPDCDQMIVPKYNLRHSGNDTGELFRCSMCGETFNLNNNLKTHMMVHTGEGCFNCSECGKTFTRKGNLKTHMLIHTGEKPFSCSECGKAFKLNISLKTHMMAHRGERAVKCSTCGKTFTQRSSLNTHMLIHTGERPFRCSDCGKSFIQNISLKNHMVIHTGKRPFSCSKCGKTFNNISNLQHHMRIHTGEKPFGCSVCGKTFTNSSNLKIHLRVHTGERPFTCSVCGQTFNQTSHLKIHIRTHTGERPFSCCVCGKSFNQTGILKIHMRIHTKKGSFSCAECGKIFAQEGYLKRHMTSHIEKKTLKHDKGSDKECNGDSPSRCLRTCAERVKTCRNRTES